MYFANVSTYYSSAPQSPKSLFESGFDNPKYNYAAPCTFSFCSKDDFLKKFKQCENMFKTCEGNINEYHIQVTSKSVAQVEYDAYTIDFSFKETDHPLKYFKLNPKMQCTSKQKTKDFNNWLESIIPLAETPGKFNLIIAVTETQMPCEVIGGFMTQCDTASTHKVFPMVRQCLYDFDTKAGNRKSFNMIKYMSFFSHDVAFLDFEDTNFVVKEMNFETGELNDWIDYDK